MRLGICVHNIELNKAERPANSLKLRFSINDNVAFRTLCSIFHHMICTLYNIQICCYSVLFICMWLILIFSWYYLLHRALKKGKRLSLTFEDILKKIAINLDFGVLCVQCNVDTIPTYLLAVRNYTTSHQNDDNYVCFDNGV